MKKILVAYDGTESADHAPSQAIQLAKAFDALIGVARTAEEGGYDTIVIGSRGLSTVERVLQGSVSEHVATHAKTTVVIAR